MSTDTAKQSSHSSPNISGMDSVALEVVPMPDEDIWKFKRERQAIAAQNVGAGLLRGDELNWFAGGLAKRTAPVDQFIVLTAARGCVRLDP